MSLQTGPGSRESTTDPIAAVRRHAGQLAAEVEQVKAAYGNTLGVRRLCSDVSRLVESIEEIGSPQPGHRPPAPVQRVRVPTEPYDESMWNDAETEGLGGLGRRTR